MAGFSFIRTDDPSPHRDHILQFWHSYLPGTPRGRLAWMTSGNPAGPAIWHLAIEEEFGEVAGMVSLMPRRMYLDGKELRAGILGDFMVAKKYRPFGPSIRLLRTAVASAGDLGVSFLYTLPNKSSIKVVEHTGAQLVAKLRCFAKPLDARFYLNKYMPVPLAAALALPVDYCLRLTSRETYLSARCATEESNVIDDSFDRFWDRIKQETSGLIGERSASYLRWRYLDSPLNQFRFLVCRYRENGALAGYAIFCTEEGNRLHIYDIMVLERECLGDLIKSLTAIGRAERRRALYFVAPDRSRRLEELRRFHFLNTRGSQRLFYYGDTAVPSDRWEFVSGDCDT